MTSNYSVNDLDDFIQTQVLRSDARDISDAVLQHEFGCGGLSEARRGVIIVADRSSSVRKVMPAINSGLRNLCKGIADDPLSAGTVDVALVSFGTDVTVHNLRNGGSVESADYEHDIDNIFVPAGDVSPDLKLEAGGLTSLNDALLAACEIEAKYAHRVKVKTRKAPYKTVVILLTDGRDEPGGDVSAAADRISKLVDDDKVLFLPFGYGNYSEEEFAQLCRADGMWFKLSDDKGKAIVDAFKLIGASMRVMSEPGAAGSERQAFEECLNASPDVHVQVCTLDDFVRGNH